VLILDRILRSSLDVVLPERCPACGVITPSGGGFCAACWPSINFMSMTGCASCNLPLPEQYMPEHDMSQQICALCMQRPPLHDGVFAAVAYGDIAKTVALRLKYAGKIGLAKMIAQHLRRFIDPQDTQPALLVPVPLHWTRLWSRSYNQAALIANALTDISPALHYHPDALLRVKRTPYLRGMTAKQRLQTVRRAFAVNPKHAEHLRNADIILVDDVYTTGATTDACVRVLKKAGARRVRIFCWARVLPNALEGDGEGTVEGAHLSRDHLATLDLAP
jgi:ComF family protein